jgi:hypothetical protein
VNEATFVGCTDSDGAIDGIIDSPSSFFPIPDGSDEGCADHQGINGFIFNNRTIFFLIYTTEHLLQLLGLLGCVGGD